VRQYDGFVVAATTADSYDVETLLKCMKKLNLLEGAVNLLGESIYVPEWNYFKSDGSKEVGEVFIFEAVSYFKDRSSN
jgi:uncharacterized Rmd1/YagE family protein